MIWPQAFEGFRPLGVGSEAAILEKAWSVFPGGVAPLERNKRDEALELNEQRMDILEPIDQAFFALERQGEQNLDSLRTEFMRANPV